MKVLVTGGAGFIASNLDVSLRKMGHETIHIDDSNVARITKTAEMRVHRNTAETWSWHLDNLGVDCVIHNAAVVGTDVVALHANEASLTNVAGTYNIVRACNQSKIPVCYMGTTVIYDTAKYQNQRIVEDSEKNPMTFYGIQKLSSEQIITSHAKEWMIIRPLFAYGGVGDMNSLIAKSIYAVKDERESLDMFLDPGKIKDYLHVSDFCDAVTLGCQEGLWGEDYNIASENPRYTAQIVSMLADVVSSNLPQIIKWHPETDYLGNHMLSSEKFRNATSWMPKISLLDGIKMSKKEILGDESGYNPLLHLDDAEDKKIKLTDFYNSNI